MPCKRLPEHYLEVLKAVLHENAPIHGAQIVWDTLHRSLSPRCKLQILAECLHLQRCFMHELMCKWELYALLQGLPVRGSAPFVTD